MALSDLDIKLSYHSMGDDNIVGKFLLPMLNEANIYKRSVGFFSSSVYELIGQGLNKFVENGGKIQIICSPELSEDDVKAIQLGYKLKTEALEELFWNDVDEVLDCLESENLKLLAKLIATSKMDLKIADVDNSSGIYHDKIGYLRDEEGNEVLFIGSPNESKNAYMKNYEKIRVYASWKNGDQGRIDDELLEFDNIWDSKNEFIVVKDYSELLGKKIQDKMATKMDFQESKKGVKLREYQKAAIDAWKNNDYRGFYVMATGTGKTWTAIYSAMEIIKEKPILLVICAPYKHLVKQWYEDVHNVLPECATVLVSSENSNWENELIDMVLTSKYGKPQTIIAISTIVSFKKERFQRVVQKVRMEKMLIVDEAHRFKERDPKLQKSYRYMLGLSATPSSKKNEESAKELLDFFGGKVFNLPIEYAIEKKFLVHYNYYPIYVEATANDEAEFNKYTKLIASCFKNGVCIDIEKVAKYKRARLRTIAMAEEKNERIEWILSQIREDDHFIVYCGDGRLEDDLRHIQFVKNELTDFGYRVSQFTATENMTERMKLVDMFNRGTIDSMVAIRCLDEGINIPSIKGALILASNDDYREFVQRRGRILRTYEDTYTGEQKEMANIYDVVVLPSVLNKNFAVIELRRVYEYMRLADNYEQLEPDFEQLCDKYEISIDEFEEMEDFEEELDE